MVDVSALKEYKFRVIKHLTDEELNKIITEIESNYPIYGLDKEHDNLLKLYIKSYNDKEMYKFLDQIKIYNALSELEDKIMEDRTDKLKEEIKTLTKEEFKARYNEDYANKMIEIAINKGYTFKNQIKEDSISIESLYKKFDISFRLYQFFEQNGYKTLADVTTTDPIELMTKHNLNGQIMNEIYSLVDNLGFKFGSREEKILEIENEKKKKNKKVIAESIKKNLEFQNLSYEDLLNLYGKEIADYLKEYAHRNSILLKDEPSTELITIEDLKNQNVIPSRLYKYLKIADYKTLNELLSNPDRLINIKGFGTSKYEILKNSLHAAGYDFVDKKEDENMENLSLVDEKEKIKSTKVILLGKNIKFDNLCKLFDKDTRFLLIKEAKYNNYRLTGTILEDFISLHNLKEENIINTRIYRALISNGCYKLGDVVIKDGYKLSSFRNFGKKNIEELENTVKKLGFSFDKKEEKIKKLEKILETLD